MGLDNIIKNTIFKRIFPLLTYAISGYLLNFTDGLKQKTQPN